MLRRTLTTPLALLLLSIVLAFAQSPPAGALGSAPCAKAPAFSCSTLAVPLDRASSSTATINLSIERKTAGATQSDSAVIALAGGPGQAALPLGEVIAKAMAPALSDRDLIVFDQRGTGTSDPLVCRSLEDSGPVATLLGDCALEVGPSRGGFTTEESVDDIEAIRHAFGYEKLVLYGTSYGTKVAEEYAERFPEHVESLVLDSVVLPGGPEPLASPTFAAITPVLTELCSDGACDGITTHPVGDLARLTAELRKHALSGSVYDGSGHRRGATLTELGLLEILEAGDLNPALRALLPAAVVSALRHDPDPLLRLHLLSEGLIPNLPSGPSPEASEASDEVDGALFYTTSCEELSFPWQRTATPATKLAEAVDYLHTQPAAEFYPFDAITALQNSLIPGCSGWPQTEPAPPAPKSLPNVPTLLLSGAQDLRTPTSNAKALAAGIPDAQLEVVPYTGHSVLGSDLSGCAEGAVAAFFAGAQVQPCSAAVDLFAPTPVVPPRLSELQATKGLAGTPGKTLKAALDTILDLQRQIIGATLQADAELPSGSSFGGLRGGYARLTAKSAVLKELCFVTGVKLSGSFPVRDGALESATIRISGSSAAAGTIRINPSAGRVSGTLAGRRFSLSLATVKLASARHRGWPARATAYPFGGPFELAGSRR